jgi:hypothetical protein
MGKIFYVLNENRPLWGRFFIYVSFVSWAVGYVVVIGLRGGAFWRIFGHNVTLFLCWGLFIFFAVGG